MKRRITISLDPHSAALLEQFQRETGRSRSYIIREALRALHKQKMAAEYEAYARDLTPEEEAEIREWDAISGDALEGGSETW